MARNVDDKDRFISPIEKAYWDGWEERAAAAVGMEDMERIFNEVMAGEAAPEDEEEKFAQARKDMRKDIADLDARGIAPMQVND